MFGAFVTILGTMKLKKKLIKILQR